MASAVAIARREALVEAGDRFIERQAGTTCWRITHQDTLLVEDHPEDHDRPSRRHVHGRSAGAAPARHRRAQTPLNIEVVGSAQRLH